MRQALVLLALAVAVAGIAATASADTAPIADSPDLPWTDPAHGSNLELLVGQIASGLAGRAVAMRCEGDTDWQTLARQQRFNPAIELGYVSIVNPLSQPPAFANFAELAGTIVCLPLKAFAAAAVKPTKCKQGRRKAVHVGPCYLGANRAAAALPASYWTAYDGYAQAIETLAHESAHLSGIFPEDVAECTGMQWIQTVAVALGDTPDDGEAIARYFWDEIYASKRLVAPAYWSADCRPGGPLDVRAPGKTAWP